MKCIHNHVVYSTTRLIILIRHALKMAFACAFCRRFPVDDGKLLSQSLAETMARHEPGSPGPIDIKCNVLTVG